ncbi:MAG: type II toxin-antitoxin system RelE/ParE family toxin [Deltaproteobacteria bacterium]|nr:type II toxin-antitoxin system RelE/ParE family toxin [Deltaproteobacteria bacterium]
MLGSFKVRWSNAAQGDLEGIVETIARDRPKTALKMLRTLRRRASTLNKNPHRGRRVPEFAQIKGLNIREMIISPWRLFYIVQEKVVYVLGLFDSRRDLEEVLFERLTRV